MSAQPQFKTVTDMPDISSMSIGNRIAWRSVGPGRGRGVFAIGNIAEGETVECSPVTIIDQYEMDLIESGPDSHIPIMTQYVFEWDVESDAARYCMGHGYLMLYNHSAEPNVKILPDFGTQTMSVLALRPIRSGEEILFDYNCKIWFEIV